jgi:hypothetical protein
MLSEQQLAQLLIQIIQSQQPQLTIQGNTLNGTDSSGNTFQLEMFPTTITNQNTAINR